MASHKELKEINICYADMYQMKSFSFCRKIMSPKIPIFLGTVTIRSR